MRSIFFFILGITFSFPLLAQKKSKTQKLFNGKDLTGWTIHGTEKWYAEGGELVCESGPDEEYGYLSTDASFKDFVKMNNFQLEPSWGAHPVLKPRFV